MESQLWLPPSCFLSHFQLKLSLVSSIRISRPYLRVVCNSSPNTSVAPEENVSPLSANGPPTPTVQEIPITCTVDDPNIAATEHLQCTIPSTMVRKQSVMLAFRRVAVLKRSCFYKSFLGEEHTWNSSLLFSLALSPALHSQSTCCYLQ